MREYMYALIPVDKAPELNISGTRHRLGEELLICESDVSTYGEPGESFESKVDRLGGIVITDTEAEQLLNK